MSGALKGISKIFSAITGADKLAKAQKKAAREQAAIQSRANEAEAQRARIQSRREARIKAAEIISSAGVTGLGLAGTSGVVGGVGAVNSQSASNISNIETSLQFNREMNAAQVRGAERIADAQEYMSGINTMFSLIGAASGSGMFSTSIKPVGQATKAGWSSSTIFSGGSYMMS